MHLNTFLTPRGKVQAVEWLVEKIRVKYTTFKKKQKQNNSPNNQLSSKLQASSSGVQEANKTAASMLSE